ncbi:MULTISPECIES: hypothetical protein [Yersinia]|uniref:Uncharacterized protein n=1 Tax=Yersinia massiliensis TaxID=419257 RepID=A0ABM6UPH7_9GAMM|nr:MULTISPECIES: hypothetical protein [Yersinia]AVX36635.1 hypothetical protein DA391_02515 [Yersinia massiliensis]QKJ11440.1 hypothetical protein HRD68_12340 [Yersinia massiliensis]CQJ26111.1 Uncharacterised protein [Yersinia mollaretii]
MTDLIMKLFGIESYLPMVKRLNDAGIHDIRVTERGGVVVGGESEDMDELRAAAKIIVEHDAIKVQEQN